MEARVEKPHRIAGYCRISVDVEADRDNTSIENQKDIISDYVQRYFPNSELTFFVDRDRSGYTFEQREDYQRMRPYLMTGQYDVLIIKDLSRFSRRNSRGLVELEDLRDAGVRIVASGTASIIRRMTIGQTSACVFCSMKCRSRILLRKSKASFPGDSRTDAGSVPCRMDMS